MAKDLIKTKETVIYETEQSFLFHNHISSDSYAAHWHDAVEIIMPIQNNYRVDIDYQTYELREYDILIVNSGGLHEMFTPSAKGQRIILQFDTEAFNGIRGFTVTSSIYANPWHITPESHPELHDEIKNLLLDIMDEHLNQNKFYDVAIVNKIISITLHLARAQKNDTDLHSSSLVKRKLHMYRLNECLNYINIHFTENLTLETVAQITGFSKFHFSRWFREYTNTSFHDYLTKVRIDKAKSLLLNTTLSILEIALESGFQSSATFNRVFKSRNNCTPKEYRYTYNQQADALSGDGDDDNDALVITTATPAPACSAKSIVPISRTFFDDMFTNPIIWADIPDPDVIRVNDTYYMISTTMYFAPGIPVMKSSNLVHWEIVNYVYDILDDSDINALRNDKHSYGKGSWAACLRYHNNTYYVLVASFSTMHTYMYQTEDIENGPWRRYVLSDKKVYHDPSLIFDDDGRVYVVYDGGTLKLVELTHDATAIKPGGIDKIIIEKADAGGPGGLPAEGSHFYKLNGFYYIFLIAWPNPRVDRRLELCYRASHVEGPYEGRVVLDDDMGYDLCGVAQGGIVDTPDGDWYAMLFQDHGSVGRIPVLVPVTWKENWPVFGVDGKVPHHMKLPAPDKITENIIISDEFYPAVKTKDFRAVNEIDYRYKHLPPNEFTIDENPQDTEILINGTFTEGINHWEIAEMALMEISRNITYNNSPVVRVFERANTSSGLKQNITDKIKPGGFYETSALVMYDTGPGEKTFSICIRNGASWEGTQVIASGKLTKGEWGFIKGICTMPLEADFSETFIFIETPWTRKPKKDTDLMDYYVANVSLCLKPTFQNTHTSLGENDPADSALSLAWQWNHNPDNKLWSLNKRPSYLRLTTEHLCRGLLDARNTLTQRTLGPVCAGISAVDVSNMKDGDFTGLAALQEWYGYVGIKMVHGEKYIIMVNASSGQVVEVESIRTTKNRFYLRIDFDFDEADTAHFYYSTDELHWIQIGDTLNMQYRLSHFTGYRFALFYYSTQNVGGYVDFDYFRLSGELIQDNETLVVLKTRFDGEKVIEGIKNNTFDVNLHMDELPEGQYEGIYLSFAIPELFDVDDIIFTDENIKGKTAFTVENGKLLMSLTGNSIDEPISYTNQDSDLFATLRFKLNNYTPVNKTVSLAPDYIYVEGGNASYLTHNLSITFEIKAAETNAIAKLPGYANPLISHKFGADPWALEYNGRLYLYMSGDMSEYNEYGQLIDNPYHKINTINVISSADFLNWTDHGEVFVAGVNGIAGWAEQSWAPAVIRKELNGKEQFFMYFSNGSENIGVLTADSPTGPWSDPIGKPLISRDTKGVQGVIWCFDPAVLVDEDNNGYLYFGGGLPSDAQNDVLHPRTARVIRLDDDMTSTIGEAITIDAPAFYVDSGIHKYNGKYYYSYCANFEGIHPKGYPPHGVIAYMTADHPTGPFTYQGVALNNPSDYFDAGEHNHHCIFTFEGQWYIAYQAQTLGKALGRVKGYRSPHLNRLSYYDNGLIRLVDADMKGVTLKNSIDPYQWVPAVTFAWCKGISVYNHYVSHIHNGDWLAISDIDFGNTGANIFRAKVASLIGGEIELRLNSPNGKIIGTLGVGVTGGEVEWDVRTCLTMPICGEHTIFFVFKGEFDGNLFNLSVWCFE